MRELGHHVARQVVPVVPVDEKLGIVLSVLSGEMTIAEAARQDQDQRAVGRPVEAAVHRGGKAGLVEGGRIVDNPVALAGAAVSVGEFTWTELRNQRQAGPDDRSKVAAMFCQIDHDVRRRFFADSGTSSHTRS